jgi:hypothetical protein
VPNPQNQGQTPFSAPENGVCPCFSVGERVRVREAYPLGHIRTPFYVRGRIGVIERVCGAFGNPEELAQMRSGEPKQPLYRVRFRQQDLWPDYAGPAHDVVEVEIYQHWLEPA